MGRGVKWRRGEAFLICLLYYCDLGNGTTMDDNVSCMKTSTAEVISGALLKWNGLLPEFH